MGHFGFSLKNLKYEAISDQDDESSTKHRLSYPAQIFGIVTRIQHPLADKMDRVFNKVHDKIKSVNIPSPRKKKKTICLRCGNVTHANSSTQGPAVTTGHMDMILPPRDTGNMSPVVTRAQVTRHSCGCTEEHSGNCQDLHFNPLLLSHSSTGANNTNHYQYSSNATTSNTSYNYQYCNGSAAPVHGEESIYQQSNCINHSNVII